MLLIGISRLSLLLLQISWDNIFMPTFQPGQWHSLEILLPLFYRASSIVKPREESFIVNFLFYVAAILWSWRGKGYAPRLARPLCWEWKSPTICDCAILWLASDYVSRRLIGWLMRYMYCDWDDGVIRVIYGRHRRTRDTWWMRLILHNNNTRRLCCSQATLGTQDGPRHCSLTAAANLYFTLNRKSNLTPGSRLNWNRAAAPGPGSVELRDHTELGSVANFSLPGLWISCSWDSELLNSARLLVCGPGFINI